MFKNTFAHIPTFLLVSFLVKLLIFQSNLPESFIAIALICLFGFVYYIENKKEKPINEDFKTQLNALSQELGDIKSYIGTNKIFGRKQ